MPIMARWVQASFVNDGGFVWSCMVFNFLNFIIYLIIFGYIISIYLSCFFVGILIFNHFTVFLLNEYDIEKKGRVLFWWNLLEKML